MTRYALQFKPRVEKDLRALPREERERVLSAVERLCRGLHGDVKRLCDFTPEFRLRVRDYRFLFEIVENTIVVNRVLRHRGNYSVPLFEKEGLGEIFLDLNPPFSKGEVNAYSRRSLSLRKLP